MSALGAGSSTGSSETPNLTAETLVEDFKASGEFEKLKADLQNQFMKDEFVGALRSQIENIVRNRVQSDEMLTYMPPAHALNDLQQNINRDGVVDRFISEEFLGKVMKEDAIAAKINEALQHLMKPRLEAMNLQIADFFNTPQDKPEPTQTALPGNAVADSQEKKEEKTEDKKGKQEENQESTQDDMDVESPS